MPIDGDWLEVLRQLRCHMPTMKHRDRWKIESDPDVQGFATTVIGLNEST
jgi:hypothetical protein